MKKKQAITVTIDGLSHEGRGISRIDGKTTFVQNALPGETVKGHYTRRKSSYNEAIAEEIIDSPNPQRVKPKCPHFGICGGCSLQYMANDLQRTIKQKALSEMLEHQAKLQPQHWLTPLISNSWGYRRKARLSVKYVAAKAKVLVGFRETNGRYVANLNQCEVLDPSVGLKLTTLSDTFMQLSIKEHIPQVEVAVGDNHTALIIRHLQPFSKRDLDLLRVTAKQHNWHLYLQPKGPDTIHPLVPEQPEKLSYDIAQHNIKIEFHPQQFTQVNQDINLQMLNQALQLLELQPEDRVIDLFCGIGNFTLPIARYAQKVIGVEADKSAVEQAKLNATNNDLSNTNFYYADLFENDYNDDWCNTTFDKVLLDPPRAGAKEIIKQILIWKPKRIVYVSCNPATLARDAQLLTAGGYKLHSAGIMDMFAHTKHVESMALFIKDDGQCN